MDSVRRLALVAIVPVLLGLAAAPAHAGTAAATVPILGDEVIALTNEERVLAGCAALSVDEDLNIAAVRQSHYMAATGDFGHVGWRGSTYETRTQDAGYEAVAGENVAYGFSSAAEVVSAWMASPEHRDNILNCDAKAFGAGVQQAGDGTYYWTQVFGWL